MIDQKVSVVVTVLNEEKTILHLLNALAKQTFPFSELIITDGGSIDKTAIIVEDFQIAHPELVIKFIEVYGNRSVGRNAAFAISSFECVAITDAGCIPHSDWLEQLVSKYEEGSVVAGYYDAKPKSAFEAAVVPYVLVMPDRVNPDTFLPATRSILLDKRVWGKVGEFNEHLQWNEDYEFAQRLVKNKIKIIFSNDAKVTWIPRQNLFQFWKMIWHFAEGDVQAKIWRKKVIFIFVRYLLGILFLSTLLLFKLFFVAEIFFLVAFLGYLSWAVLKNLRYAMNGWYWLPILQITSDLAVMGGSLVGIVN